MNNLFPIQRDLDKTILVKYAAKKKVNYEELYNNKMLALFVEIGELANETKCFKYWSEKQNRVSEKALEEYVDCLHFILSIGNSCSYSNLVKFNFERAYTILMVRNKCELNRTDNFIYLIESLNRFIRHKELGNYQEIINDFLIIAIDLGFTEDQLIKAYMDKNLENYNRQKLNY